MCVRLCAEQLGLITEGTRRTTIEHRELVDRLLRSRRCTIQTDGLSRRELRRPECGGKGAEVISGTRSEGNTRLCHLVTNQSVEEYPNLNQPVIETGGAPNSAPEREGGRQRGDPRCGQPLALKRATAAQSFSQPGRQVEVQNTAFFPA